jgi:uncharacterized protein YutE (UPF0331/DUF86 family)
MVGFRTIAVHAYEDLDPARVEAIVADHLGELLELGRVIVMRFLHDPS